MGSNIYYLLIRHQPVHKRNKSNREYWDDLLGKEYHFGKGVVNHKKIQPGTKTIWFYADRDKLYFWGHGVVDEIRPTNNDEFIASYSDFNYFDQGSAIEANSVVQKKLKSLAGWNPYNSIIEITEDIYNDIVGYPLQLEIFEDEPLQMPTEDEINKGYEEICKFLLIPKEKVIEILTALTGRSHVLLAGPIGTGKTRLAKMIPEIFWETIGGYHADQHTATADWSTQDVVGGIMPKMDGDNIAYKFQYGCATDTIQKNWQYGVDGGQRCTFSSSPRHASYRGVWLVIDEFNRADIDKAFGSLFTALRTRTLKIPSNKSDEVYTDLHIPDDYRIICTLNTADKHFLFRLSDALKSRFAYIEVDVPGKENIDNEIFYSMNNAIVELGLSEEEWEPLVLLDRQNRKIIKGKSNDEFYTRAYQAYRFLDSVRLFKKIGTALLQYIYQNMLVRTRMTGDVKTALDNSLTSTLVPQLEELPQSEIGAIRALHGDDLIEYFKSAYKSPMRQSYSKVFMEVMRYLQVPEPQYKGADSRFMSGNLEDNIWDLIRQAYDATKVNFDLDLDKLKRSLDELKKDSLY